MIKALLICLVFGLSGGCTEKVNLTEDEYIEIMAGYNVLYEMNKQIIEQGSGAIDGILLNWITDQVMREMDELLAEYNITREGLERFEAENPHVLRDTAIQDRIIRGIEKIIQEQN
ncbi:MAG: hypothetical protein GX817_04645 [Elusimicrobia bacterium]|nr:hypothetical protein [Elusimicrobiota bacterium]